MRLLTPREGGQEMSEGASKPDPTLDRWVPGTRVTLRPAVHRGTLYLGERRGADEACRL
jgi:hypothetical protein